MKNIAVLFDSFLMGGRETYVVEILDELNKRIELTCGLIAKKISLSQVADAFDYKVETGTIDANLTRFIENLKPELIWVQHSEFLHAIGISKFYGIPILPTFHTPFKKGTIWNDPVLMMGSALVINRSPLIAGVSNEILRTLMHLGVEESKLRLLPNRVRVFSWSEKRVGKIIYMLSCLAEPENIII